MDEDLADLRYRVDLLEDLVRNLAADLDLLRRRFEVHVREHGA